MARPRWMVACAYGLSVWVAFRQRSRALRRYTALITDSFIDNKGITASETTAVTIVYVRRGGEWKMVQDHESLLQK